MRRKNLRNLTNTNLNGCGCSSCETTKVNGWVEDLTGTIASGEPLAKAEVSISMASIIGLGIAVIGAGLVIKKF